MNIWIYTLAFNATLGGFDDTEMRDFNSDKRVETIDNHAFMHDGIPI